MHIIKTKEEFRDSIKREFGYPQIRVELDDKTIDLKIDQAISKFVKHATGQSKQEVFFTFPISGGVNTYQMPVAVDEIINYNDYFVSPTQINTLFTLGNYMYNTGVFDPIFYGGGGLFNLVSYQIALDFIETMSRYFKNTCHWKYDYYNNSIILNPAPSFDSTLYTPFAMIQAYIIEGTDLNATERDYSYFYSKEWVFRYSVALCKKILGEIREKFQSFNSIGNTGISLNGGQLKNEGDREIELLERKLIEEEQWNLPGISMYSI